MPSVTIAIQARTNSQRLPGKVFKMLGRATVLKHVLDACTNAATYINNWNTKKIFVNVAICTPFGDPILGEFDDEIPVVEGPELDVLSRYMNVLARFKSDYVVRITSDCPLIQPALISKHIQCAVMNQLDYLSNVDERCRTAPDGHDCEVISNKLLTYANANAKDGGDREHVTTFIRREYPEWAKTGMIVNFLDLSDIKISLDNQEDFVFIEKKFKQVQEKLRLAQEICGRENVFRF